MSDLYFEGSVTTALDAAKTAGQYAIRKEFTDIHFVDALLEGMGQIHVLTRDHAHEPVPVGTCPEDPEALGAKIVELCEAPSPVGSTKASLNPAQIALLMQLGQLLADLYLKWQASR